MIMKPLFKLGLVERMDWYVDGFERFMLSSGLFFSTCDCSNYGKFGS